MSVSTSNHEEAQERLWVLSCKMKGLAHLIKYQSSHSLMGEQAAFGIGELIHDFAMGIDAIRGSLE